MEAFVDRIIDTDRKAREMIGAAQQQKAAMHKKAVEDAHAALAASAAQDKIAMAQQDEKMAERATAAKDLADADYMREKHKLDEAFAAGIDGWLDEITNACVTVR